MIFYTYCQTSTTVIAVSGITPPQQLFNIDGGYKFRRRIQQHELYHYQDTTSQSKGERRRRVNDSIIRRTWLAMIPLMLITRPRRGGAHQQRFKQKLINFIIHGHAAISVIENMHFRSFVYFLCVNNRGLPPKSSQTLGSWL